MIKGVNRHVVEISGMESDYFEKAVLYIKSDKSSALPARIDLEARAELGRLMPEMRGSPERHRRHIEARVTAGIIGIVFMLIAFGAIFLLANGVL
jgi:hypothetical protein